MKASRLITVLVVGAIFIAIGVLVGTTSNLFPVEASAEAASVDSLFKFMLSIAVVIFLIVEGGLVYTIFRFRRRGNDETDGLPDHGNTALEITWTAIPAVIVFVLAVYSFQVYAENASPRENAVVVHITGQQFLWSFSYELPASTDPNLSNDQKERILSYMTSDVLHVPMNRPVEARIQAKDVMHAFFVPEFRLKQDAIPGHITTVYFTPSREGTYDVYCAELCGTGHADMSKINKVMVESQADYDKFVEGLYQKALAIINDPRNPEVGKQLLASGKYPCSGCHILTDAYPSQNKTGPSLNGIATRAADHAAKGEGVIGGNDAAAYIRTSILNPNNFVVPGYSANIMPQNFGDRTVMPEDDLEAIVNYLLLQK